MSAPLAVDQLDTPGTHTRLAAVPVAEFDGQAFRSLARQALADAGSPDPAVVAELLLDSLTDAQCRVALGATLPNWMRVLASQQDRTVRHEAATPRTTPTTAQRVTSWYQRTLATRIMVGDQWKFLGDCTADDLTAAADVRLKAAAATKAEGDRLQALAEQMRASGAKTVSKVKADVLQRVYGGQS